MGVLAWWIIPLAAGVLAALWAAWSARTRRTGGDRASLATYERFRDAMERQTTGVGPSVGPGAPGAPGVGEA